jgi:hypothetical protein
MRSQHEQPLKTIDSTVMRDIIQLVTEVRRLRAPVEAARQLNQSRQKFKGKK